MSELIELVREDKINCPGCGVKAVSSWFLIKDTKPWKMMTLINCPSCGSVDKKQLDYIELDYGVEITANFTSKSISDRLCFINNEAMISVFRDDQKLIEFKSEDSFVDCIESLLLRAQELIEVAFSKDYLTDPIIKNAYDKIIQCQKDGVVKIVVIDGSGYSKICPCGKEYTECQEWAFEELNEEGVVEHVQIPK